MDAPGARADRRASRRCFNRARRVGEAAAPELKAGVRKLKALGLTESREVGYRLTSLGRAVTRAPEPEV